MWAKRLLAFGACSTIAGLLLMRILPELAADPEDKIMPETPPIPVERDHAEISPGAGLESPATILLPPPPAPEFPAPPKAKQATDAPQPVAPIDASRPLAVPVEVNAAVEAAPKPKNKASIGDIAPLKKSKSKSKPAVVAKRTAAVPSHNLNEVLSPSPRPDRRAAPTEVQFITPSPSAEAEGRVLLRILEHGSGPEIEIAWPVAALQRRALYRLFESCYGMEIAIIDIDGRLYGGKGVAGRPWRPNLDRYSGFVRQPSGRLTKDEIDGVARIRTRHGGLREADNVRLFPRRLDAMLLGGLKALIGERYVDTSAIRAHYRRDGNAVLVEGIRRDGRPVLGRIDLSAAARNCRSDGWS